MRDYAETAFLNALDVRSLEVRYYLRVVAKDFSTNDPVEGGFWTGTGTKAVTVLDADSLTEVSYSFIGSGTISKIPQIPLTSDISVREVTISLDANNIAVHNFTRGNNLRFATAQLYRGLLNLDTQILLSPPHPILNGFVDGAPVSTGAVGQDSTVDLKIVSTTRELTRASTELRSGSSQRLRDATDAFYDDVGTVASREIYWGQKGTRMKDGAAGQDGFFSGVGAAVRKAIG